MDELLLLMRVVVSLAAVLGLLWFLQRRLARRTRRSREAEAITVLGRRGVGAKAQLVVAEAEGNRYVLGVTEHGVTVIDKLPGRAPTRPAPVSPVRTRVAGPDDRTTSTDFDRLFASESLRSGSPATGRETGVADPPLRRDRAAQRVDPLHGSILSPGTWRQTADFLRRRR